MTAGPKLWQTVQTRERVKLRLPPGKMCSADYAGLLPALRVFISDELVARGFCQIQVCAWPPARAGARAGLGVSVSGGPRGSREPRVPLPLILPIGKPRFTLRESFGQG